MLLCPAVAWLRDRRYAGIVRLLRPELGLLQVTPRPVVEGLVRRLVPGASDGWAAAGVDEFLRSYLTPRGRAAFYAAARNIYLDEPDGDEGFWTRLSRHASATASSSGARTTGSCRPASAATWRSGCRGRSTWCSQCGHVPQVEVPAQTHHAMSKFLG